MCIWTTPYPFGVPNRNILLRERIIILNTISTQCRPPFFIQRDSRLSKCDARSLRVLWIFAYQMNSFSLFVAGMQSNCDSIPIYCFRQNLLNVWNDRKLGVTTHNWLWHQPTISQVYAFIRCNNGDSSAGFFPRKWAHVTAALYPSIIYLWAFSFGVVLACVRVLVRQKQKLAVKLVQEIEKVCRTNC